MKTTLLALALIAAPFAASAAPLSYTYVEGGYDKLHVDYDDSVSSNADGAYLKGSYDIGSGFNAIASYQRVEDSGFALGGTYHYDDSVTQSEIGFGYHSPIGQSTDFIAELAWTRFKAAASVDGFGGDSESAIGGRGAIGVRSAFNDRVEGLLKVNYYDGNDFDGSVTGTVGVQVKLNPTWGITAEVEHGDLFDDLATTRYQVGVRASF